MARVGVTKKVASDFMDGKSSKPRAKGKMKRDELKTDTELQGKMTDHLVTHAKKRDKVQEVVTRVGANSIRGVMSETMARCYGEFWPTMETYDFINDRVKLDISEEAYILTNAMVCGSPHVEPRRPTSFKEVENLGDTALTCQECAE